MSTGFHLRRQRHETAARIWQVVQDADRKGVIKFPRQREMVYVRLDDVRVWQRTCGGEGSIDGAAEIDADHLACSPTCGELRVASLAATAFEHHLVAEELRRHGCDPAEKLFCVA